ncbi:MAG: Ig-like domain-containing protein, partial [Candidatus Zixiibacteriota bacterium]
MYKGILIFAISFLIMKPMLVLETKNDKDNYLIKNQSYETSNDTVTINGIRSSVRFINAHGDIKNNVTTKSYCVGEWQGGGAYSWNNFFTGSEYYAVYQDMYLSGCYDIFPFNVTEIEWYLYGRVDNITIEVQPLIYEADYSDPNCLKPGEIFFAGPVYEVNLPSSGGYILGLPFLEPACVNGPYFAGIYISTYLGSGIIEVVIDDETAIECKSYNYYTEEFLDLVTAYGITGNLELWSVGYSSDQNECQPLFTTTVINTMPLVNFSNIPIYTQIDAIFDSSMNPSTINNSTFIVHASQTGLHTGIISYDEPSKTATFDPAVDFAPGEVVTVTLTDAIESTDGISLKPYSWSFTIENEEGGMDFLIS